MRIEVRKSAKFSCGIAKRSAVSTSARAIGSSECPAGEVGQDLVAPARQLVGALLRGEGRVEVVDDLVGVAGEAVEGVHERPLARGQQPGGQVVRAAVVGVQLPAGLVGRPHLRIGDPCGIELSP